MDEQLKTEKQKEWDKLLAKHANKSETLEEWKERVKFAAGFS